MSLLVKAQPYDKGGPSPRSAVPTNAAECRALLAVESVKQSPNAAKVRSFQTLLESFERQESIAAITGETQLAQSQADNAALQTAITALRESLAASEAKRTALAIPHDAVADTNRACESLRRDIARANTDRDSAVKSQNEAITLRDAALEGRRTAEQGEARVRQLLEAEFMKLLTPLENALRLFRSSGVEARDYWYRLNQLADDFKRGLAEAIAKPCPSKSGSRGPSEPVNLIKPKTLSAEELRTAREALVEQARVENLNQPGSVDPSCYEPMRERFIPRSEPETRKQITGAAYELC